MSKLANLLSSTRNDSVIILKASSVPAPMRNLEDLNLVRVWVNPHHKVESALMLLKGHRLRAIAVLDEGELVGVLSADRAEMADPDAPVHSVMKRQPTALDSHILVPKAAQIFTEQELDYAPVVSDNKFIGMLTTHMLLKELRRSWDPLTSLGWSDRLREWGVEKLKSGQEITLLFIDLNNFGQYNKTYGHTVGDKVLRQIAALLKENIDKEHDILVRYGGDEFAIGTTRGYEQAANLARTLRERAANLFVEDLTKPVSFSIGIAGGRRTKEREHVHYAATLDELINSASKACIAHKKTDSDQNLRAITQIVQEQAEKPGDIPRKDP